MKEIATPDRMEYTFMPVTTGSMLFKVKAANDAHLALAGPAAEGEPMYELFIGGWGNAKTALRKNRQKPDVVVVDTPNILSASEPRGFWVRWNNGHITMGKEGQSIPLLEWQDPEPFGIGHYGIRTGWGANGVWMVEDGDTCKQLETEDKLEYRWEHVQQGCLNLEVCCPHNAHVALTCGPCESELMYEIMLGGWENTASVIRYRREQPDKARAQTPALLCGDDFRKFCIAWKNGHIWVTDSSGRLLMEWKNQSPFGISHFGVRTAWGANGQWKLATTERPEILMPSAPAPQQQQPGWATPGSGGECATWVDCSHGIIPPNAVPAGMDGSEQLFIGRARHAGDIIPGKVKASHQVCYVPWGGVEQNKTEYQVLCNCKPVWMPATGGRIPAGALPGGETAAGETLFIGRATHNGEVCVGKVQETHGTCYIPYGGQEHACTEYEVLCAQ